MAKIDMPARSTQRPAPPVRNTEQPQSADQVSLCIMVTPEQRREIKSFAAGLGLSNKDLILRAIAEYRHD